jgi:hypothetical protein
LDKHGVKLDRFDVIGDIEDEELVQQPEALANVFYHH